MATNIPNRDFFLPHELNDFNDVNDMNDFSDFSDTMARPAKKPRYDWATDAASAAAPSPPIDMSGGLPQDPWAYMPSSGDSFDAFLSNPNAGWNTGTGGFSVPPPQDPIAPTIPTSRGESLQPLSIPHQTNHNWISGTAPPPNHHMPAPTHMDPDLQMEFELNTSMGMVLRPSPTQQSPASSHFSAPSMRPGSPSDFLDMPGPAPASTGGAMIGRCGPGPIQGLGRPAEAADHWDGRGMDQAMANLGRLDGSLRAAARRQMSLISDTNTASERVY